MLAKFSAPLAYRIKPEYRPYPSQSLDPEINRAREPLGGAWRGVDALPYARRRALHQLLGRVRKLKDHDSAWAYLVLAAPRSEHKESQDDLPETAVLSPVVRHEPAQISFDTDALGLVEQVAKEHHHVDTVCLALIKLAKDSGGVLPSSDFLWTRSADPEFWLLINGYGRRNHKPEVAAAFVHFALERKFGRPISEVDYA